MISQRTLMLSLTKSETVPSSLTGLQMKDTLLPLSSRSNFMPGTIPLVSVT